MDEESVDADMRDYPASLDNKLHLPPFSPPISRTAWMEQGGLTWYGASPSAPSLFSFTMLSLQRKPFFFLLRLAVMHSTRDYGAGAGGVDSQESAPLAESCWQRRDERSKPGDDWQSSRKDSGTGLQSDRLAEHIRRNVRGGTVNPLQCPVPRGASTPAGATHLQLLLGLCDRPVRARLLHADLRQRVTVRAR